MDTTAQQTQQDDQYISSPTQQLPASQTGDTQVIQQAEHPQTPHNTKGEEPVSVPSSSKEGGPMLIRTEVGVSASVPEIEISPEMQQETGAEVVHETPQLTPADTQAGIQHAKESVPVTAAPTTTITLPMSQVQAQQTVKTHKKVKDSLYWLAMLIVRQWQLAQKKKA